MYCPNCGKTNSSENKFCRACGLNMEDATRSLIDQLPAVEHDRRIVERKRLVENVLLKIGGVGLAAFILLILWVIVTEIIIGKGQLVGGIIGVLFVLGMSSALALVAYRQFLIEATAKRKLPAAGTPIMDAATRQLTDPYFEPAQSVTESTTDLLSTEVKPPKRAD